MQEITLEDGSKVRVEKRYTKKDIDITVHNLNLLADYLEGNIHQSQFDMNQFRKDDDYQYGSECDFVSKKDCGTIGCALGWAPFVKGLETKPRDFRGDDSLDFHDYCDRIFPLLRKGDNTFMNNSWDFLFSGKWTYYDNTVSGAVERMRTLAKMPELFTLELDE